MVITAGAIAAGAYIWWNQSMAAPGIKSATTPFVITRGSSAQTVGNNLHKEGLIRSPFAFKLYIQAKGLTKKIPIGQFEIPANSTLPQVVAVLLKGPTQLWVTIPEGLRREEIAVKISESLELSGSAKDTFRNDFLALTTNLEGHLFPETYLFPRTVTAQRVVDRLTATFDQKFGKEFPENGVRGLNIQQVTILASLLERETRTNEERPVVAGILFNRLEADWPLQLDASAQYALANVRCRNTKDCTWWPRPLTLDDLKIDSPYNTYQNTGLPPAPIANPGLSSLKAVVNAQETPYWYYIHDTSGQIRYGRTLDEHNQNVQKYLR